jgi:hypothetical protein
MLRTKSLKNETEVFFTESMAAWKQQRNGDLRTWLRVQKE